MSQNPYFPLPSEEQSRLLITAIYTQFRETNQWPFLRDLTIQFRTQFRADRLIDTLRPQWVVASGSLDQDGSTVALKLDALVHIPDARPDLESAVRLIARAADAYVCISTERNEGADRWTFADAAKALDASTEETDRAFRLVSTELRLFRTIACSTDGHVNWVGLGSDLLEFEGVDSPEVYFARRAEFSDCVKHQHQDTGSVFVASQSAINEDERSIIRHAVARVENILTAVATGQATDTTDFEESRDTLVKSALVKEVIPEFVVTCHTPGEFEGMMKRDVSGYQERRRFISDAFAPVKAKLASDGLGALDEAMTRTLSPYDRLTAKWLLTRNRVNDDPAGAITAARSLLESALKHALDEHGVPYTALENVPSLTKRYVSHCLRNAPPQSAAAVRQLSAGVTTAAHALSQIRNELGDAHGSSPGIPQATIPFARLAVDVASALTLFVLSKTSFD